MKKIILLFAFLQTFSNVAKAQVNWHWVIDATPSDSSAYTFSVGESLDHKAINGGKIDTTGCLLWRIGPCNKTFGATAGVLNQRMIVTDTLNPYPVNTNESFVLKNIKTGNNVIITFMHKYQTRAGMDGCIVEYSDDNGVTWDNVKGDCNMDSVGGAGVLTENFYEKTDTLATGEQAFSGTSNGWITSRVQFFWGIPIRTTGTGGCDMFNEKWIRFRFKSDANPDTLDGWAIGNIKIEHDDYGSGVVEGPYFNTLPIFPNPATGSIHLPALINESKYAVKITNPVGQVLLNTNYKHEIDLSRYATGIYYYFVTDGTKSYSGKIQKE